MSFSDFRRQNRQGRHNPNNHQQSQPLLSVVSGDGYYPASTVDSTPLLTGRRDVREDLSDAPEEPVYGQGLLVILVYAMINMAISSGSWGTSLAMCPTGDKLDHAYDCIWYGVSGWAGFYSLCVVTMGLLIYGIERCMRREFRNIHYSLVSFGHVLGCSLGLGGYILYRYFTHGHNLEFDLYHMNGSWYVSMGGVLGFNLIFQGIMSFLVWIIPKVRDEF